MLDMSGTQSKTKKILGALLDFATSLKEEAEGTWEAEGEVIGNAERSCKDAQAPSLLFFKLAVLICYLCTRIPCLLHFEALC